MTTQRLSTIVNIGGGLSGAFRRSVDEGSQGIGRMSSQIRQASATARSLQQQLDDGELGKDGIAAATRSLRQYDNTLEELRAQHGVLERQLEAGELGRSEAAQARRTMQGLADQMQETEQAAGRLRTEMEESQLGRDRIAAATRSLRQYDNTLEELRAQHGVLERQLEAGELGRSEAAQARRTMQGLADQMQETEQAAGRLRTEIQSEGLGRETAAALRREIARLHGDVDAAATGVGRSTGRMSSGMRRAADAARNMQRQIDSGRLGRDGIEAADRAAQEFEDSLRDIRARHSALERQLERGNLGEDEANRARGVMERLTREMRETEEAAGRIRQEIRRGELGRETVAALRREVRRLNGEIGEANAGLGRTGPTGRASFGRVAAGAAVVTGGIAAIGVALNGSVRELQELRQLQFRAGLADTQGLQRAGLAFQQLGIESQEGADFFAESVSEIRLRLGELAAEGKQSQLEIAKGLGVDLSALANLGDEDLILAQFAHVRRVYREQGADVARALTESFQGGVEAQRLASIAALPQAEYEAFIATLREGATTSEETFADIQRLGVGFGVAGTQAERLKRTVVAGLTPGLGSLLDRVTPLIETTADWLEENRTAAAIIGGVVLGGIVALTIAIGALATVALLGLVPAGVATVVAWAPVIAIVLAIIAAVGLLIAAGVLLYKNWDQLVYEFRQGWDDLKIMGLQGADFIIAQIERILNAAGPLVSLGEKVAGLFGFDVDVRGGVASARAGIANEITQTQAAQAERGLVRAADTIRRQEDDNRRPGAPGGFLGGIPVPGAPAPATVIEGDTIIQNDIDVNQNESEDVDTVYARISQLSRDQADALAGAAGNR